MTTDPSPQQPFTWSAPTRRAIRTADGLDLRCELTGPEQVDTVVVLSHPHPLHGGNMYASVIQSMFAAASSRGMGGLRYNFRGVAGSEGQYSYGAGERLDLAAAIDAAGAKWPGATLVLAGWSFGADVSLSLADERIAGWCLAAPPLSTFDAAQFVAGPDDRPKLLVVGSGDQFNPPDRAAAATENWSECRIAVLPEADHFFAGREPELADRLIEFARALDRPRTA